MHPARLIDPLLNLRLQRILLAYRGLRRLGVAPEIGGARLLLQLANALLLACDVKDAPIRM